MNTLTTEFKIISNAIKAENVTPVPYCGNIANTARQVFPYLKIKGIYGYPQRPLGFPCLPWLDHVYMVKDNVAFDGFGEHTSEVELAKSYVSWRHANGYVRFVSYKIVDVVLCEDDVGYYFAINNKDGEGVEATVFDQLRYTMETFKDIEYEKRIEG